MQLNVLLHCKKDLKKCVEACKKKERDIERVSRVDSFLIKHNFGRSEKSFFGMQSLLAWS